MNVAELSLCKELYGYTANVWHDQTDYQYAQKATTGKIKLVRSEPGRSWPKGYYTAWPAYSLGYLLRKLPLYCELHRAIYMDRWVITTDGEFHKAIEMTADTPEDACAKLAIELIKQKVITP